MKAIATTLAAVVLSLPISTQALAANHHDASPARNTTRVEMRQDAHKAPAPKQKIEIRHDEHKNVPLHAPAHHKPEKHHSSSSTGNFITGAVVGAIIGAVIANNS